jgi:hypothetical protein
MMRNQGGEIYDDLNLSPTSNDVYISDDEGFNRQYDLTPLSTTETSMPMHDSEQRNLSSPSYSIDPWESMSPSEREEEENEEFVGNCVAPK